MKKLEAHYWNQQYKDQRSGWDIGYASPAIIAYFQQIPNKQACILIPGAGNAWEAEKLWSMGFTNIYVLDFSQEALLSFQTRVPHFPKSQILNEDFFHHQGSYDYIVEQTFLSSLPINLREDYVKQVFKVLKPQGRLMGLLFNHHFNHEGPPFGGTVDEYKLLFSSHFKFHHFKIAHNSIKPRKKRELFVLLEKTERIIDEKP